MLRKVSTTAILLALTTATVDVASAQSLRNADEPAEFPPASFSGRQYVDSRGCVYVRAGFDGAVTWVPRVTRGREVVCGQQPTFASAPAPDVPVVPDETRVATTTPTPSATPTPTPTVRPPAQTARPTQPPRPVVAQPRVVTPAPVRTTKPAPVPVAPAPTTRVVKAVPTPPPARTVTSVCPGASTLSQQYLNSSFAVRCGPQGTHPGAGTTGVPAQTATVQPKTVRVAPPQGYKPAYTDGRHNTNRGPITAEGNARMKLVWTTGVPRRLIDQNSGRDVTAAYPNLRFPFISMKEQKRYVAQHGWPAASRTQTSSVTVATKTTPPATTATRTVAPTSHRYVQVGTFGQPSNAQNTAARLQQMGLPVRVGTYQKAGKTYRIVLAGPFNDRRSLSSALSAARRAGFSDAFTRK